MTSPRIASLLVVALLPLASCERGCGREHAVAPLADERTAPTTVPAPSVAAPSRPAAVPGPYQLQRPTGWKAGDIISGTGRTHTTGRIEQRKPDGAAEPPLRFTETIEAAWTEQVAEVDGEGHRTRSIVILNEWARKRERERDTSIAGAALTVRGDGANRSWSFVTHKDEPTPEAKNWLDERFGAHGLSDETWLQLMLPADRVPVGETFRPDPETLARAVTESGLSVDRSKVSASVTLQAVEGSTARSAFEAALPLTRVPNSDIPWSSGGTLTFAGTFAVPLEPAPLILAELDRTAKLAGEAVQDDVTLDYDFVTHERRTTTWGGNLPAAPAAR